MKEFVVSKYIQYGTTKSTYFYQLIIQIALSDFKDMSRFPYETETSFKSTYIEAFHIVKTQSIKR